MIENITHNAPVNDSIVNIKNMFRSERFKKYPLIEREDIYIYLIDNGVSSEDAIKAWTRYNTSSFSDLLESYHFENEFYELIKCYTYLFRRSFNAAMVYNYLLIAKYAEINYNIFVDAMQMYVSVAIYSRNFFEDYLIPESFFKNTAVISFYDPDRYNTDKSYTLVDYSDKTDNVLYIPLDDFQTELPEAGKIAEFVYSASRKICKSFANANRGRIGVQAVLLRF